MRARIYARVSTEEQAETGFSLAAQAERLEAFCRSQGWSVAGRYVDEGASGKNLNRPAFRRLMAEAEAGDVILVYKLDRLTRSVRDLDDLLRDLEARQVHFRSATEQFDTTTATGRLFIRLVAEIAQWERETIAERAALGKQKKAAQGEWGGGRPPLGYLAVPSGRVKAGRTLLEIVPDPVTRHLIPLIFERYLAGHGVRGIARWLNEELGARTRAGQPFHSLAVSRLLTNPLYCGMIPAGSGQRVAGSHEPLVSREIFDRAQALRGVRGGVAPRQATGQYPLSGIARCGACGGRVDGHRRGDGGRTRVYRCHSYMTGRGCRGLASASAAAVEENLIALLVRDHREPPQLQVLLAELAAGPRADAGAEAARLKQDLAESEAVVGRWTRLFERGGIGDEEYLAAVRPHRERIRAVRERLAEQEGVAGAVGGLDRSGVGAVGGLDRPGVGGDASAGLALDLRAAWEALEPPERKALLQHFTRAFGAEIRIHPDRRVEVRPAADQPAADPHRAAGRTPGRRRATQPGACRTSPATDS